MVTTITRYPPTNVQRACAVLGGIAAFLLLALGALNLMQSAADTAPTASRATSLRAPAVARPVISVIAQRE